MKFVDRLVPAKGFAISLAEDVLHQQKVCMGAVLTDRRGNVLSSGNNSLVTSHPVQAHWAKHAGREKSIYLHAEIAAMINNKTNLEHTIIVARILKNGMLSKSFPCKICMLALMKMTSVERIVYADWEGDWKEYFIYG